MGKQQRSWAKTLTARFRLVLGNRCAYCGSQADLTFDCIRARGGEHHALEYSSRLAFYRREMAAGNLQLLCRVCNGRKGARAEERYRATSPALAPPNFVED